MELGAGFPQRAIGSDNGALRDYVQGVEQLGYTHIRAADHVLGADASQYELEGPYTHHAIFREPLVMFGYVAALTSRIKLITSVLILSQRQTALVAKQAAEVDLLSGGRLELGIGSGWNEVEYEALGVDFATRGSRIEEQIALLRRLWEEPLVTFEGEHHAVRDDRHQPAARAAHPDLDGRLRSRDDGAHGDASAMVGSCRRASHSPEGFLPRRDRVLAAAEQAGPRPLGDRLQPQRQHQGQGSRRATAARRAMARHGRDALHREHQHLRHARRSASTSTRCAPSSRPTRSSERAGREGWPVKIYTRTGDEGDTGLFGGPRVPKDDAPRRGLRRRRRAERRPRRRRRGPRPRGLTRPRRDAARRSQSTLFDLGGELATPDARERAASGKVTPLLAEGASERLEGWIDTLEQELEPLTQFILPGGAPVAAALHHARTVWPPRRTARGLADNPGGGRDRAAGLPQPALGLPVRRGARHQPARGRRGAALGLAARGCGALR